MSSLGQRLAACIPVCIINLHSSLWPQPALQDRKQTHGVESGGIQNKMRNKAFWSGRDTEVCGWFLGDCCHFWVCTVLSPNPLAFSLLLISCVCVDLWVISFKPSVTVKRRVCCCTAVRDTIWINIRRYISRLSLCHRFTVRWTVCGKCRLFLLWNSAAQCLSVDTSLVQGLSLCRRTQNGDVWTKRGWKRSNCGGVKSQFYTQDIEGITHTFMCKILGSGSYTEPLALYCSWLNSISPQCGSVKNPAIQNLCLTQLFWFVF